MTRGEQGGMRLGMGKINNKRTGWNGVQVSREKWNTIEHGGMDDKKAGRN